MASRYIRGMTSPVIAPVLTAQAVAVGDLVGLSSGNVVRAEDETWDTSLLVTQKNFVEKFLGVSGQEKDANVARVPANGQDNVIRVDPEGVWEFDCASATFAVGDLVGPAKQSGNALESQKVVAVAVEEAAIGRVVEAGSSVTKVKVRVFSVKVPAARQGAVDVEAGGAMSSLTENSGAIGGTNDGNLPDLTATAAALTDNSGGSETPDGTISEIADIALSTSDTYTDAAVNAAVNAVVDDCANAIEECAAMINKLVTDNVALRAAIRENATKINAIITALEAAHIVS